METLQDFSRLDRRRSAESARGLSRIPDPAHRATHPVARHDRECGRPSSPRTQGALAGALPDSSPVCGLGGSTGVSSHLRLKAVGGALT